MFFHQREHITNISLIKSGDVNALVASESTLQVHTAPTAPNNNAHVHIHSD